MTLEMPDLIRTLELASHAGDRALRTYGTTTQRKRAIEECAELICALAHSERDAPSDVPSEIADVLIMALQMARVYGLGLVVTELRRKSERLNARLTAAGT